MPAQYFAVDDASAPIVTIYWDMGYRPIDVSFRGELVTRLNDDAALRATGLQGPAPDGTVLVVGLGPSPSGETFRVERDGVKLHASPVDYTAIRPRTWATAMAGVGAAGGTVATGGAVATGATTLAGPTVSVGQDLVALAKVKTARSWIRGLGILAFISAALLWIVASLAASTTSSTGTRIDPSGLRVVALTMLVVGAVRLGLAAAAKGERTTVVLGISLALEGLNLLLSVANLARGTSSVIIGVVLAAVGTWRIFEGWQASRQLPRAPHA